MDKKKLFELSDNSNYTTLSYAEFTVPSLLINQEMRTNQSGLFAVGDVTRYPVKLFNVHTNGDPGKMAFAHGELDAIEKTTPRMPKQRKLTHFFELYFITFHGRRNTFFSINSEISSMHVMSWE